MAMQIPAFLLTDTVTVEPYHGLTAAGVTFGAARVVRAHVQATRTHRRDQHERSGRWRVWIRPGLDVPIGSRVTVAGQTATVTEVGLHDQPRLPVPSHLEFTCEAVAYMASSLITITRGVAGTNPFGDPVDSTTPIASGVPALIVQTSQDTYRPVDQRGGVVETFTIRMPAGTGVVEGDRLTDERTTAVYIAERIDAPLSTTGPALGADDVVVTARRVAATSTP